MKDVLYDNTLVHLFVELDSEKYFEMLYDKYAAQTYRLCLSYVWSESAAQSVMKTVWTKVYFNLDSFTGESAFSSWLSHITVEACCNHLWRQGVFKSFETIDDEDLTTLDREFGDLLQAIERKEDVAHCIALLPRDMQIILRLKQVHEYTNIEISEMTGLSLPVLTYRIRKTKKFIQEYHE